jgi:SAM-dependent methyltransferase
VTHGPERFDREYFRELYGEAPRQTRFDRARDDRVVLLVRRHAPSPGDGAALLDIGCGYGYLLRRFRGRYRLVGIDVSAHAVRETTGRIPGALVVTADVQRSLPFDRPFDVVLAVNVIEHLPDPPAAVPDPRTSGTRVVYGFQARSALASASRPLLFSLTTTSLRGHRTR